MPYFGEKSFLSGYAEGSTGMQVIPDIICVIIKNSEVVYFRSYHKRLQYLKVKDKPDKLMKINRKLFDKL